MKCATFAMLAALIVWIYPHQGTANDISRDSSRSILPTVVNLDDKSLPRLEETRANQGSAESNRVRVGDTQAHTEMGIPHDRLDVTKEQVIGLIKFYAGKYQVSEDLALRIAAAESGFNPTARNKTSRACGVFQYLPSTWIS